MGWARRRLTGWLALAALALQFAVSFGHIHSDVLAAPGAFGTTQASPASDAPNDHPDSEHATCDICATVHLAGALLLPAPPALVVPAAFASPVFAATSPRAHRATTAAGFHARGPPARLT